MNGLLTLNGHKNMAILNHSNIQSAILGNSKFMVGDNPHYWNPIESAISLLVTISGGHQEVYGYYSATDNYLKVHPDIFRQILKNTAYQIFKHQEKNIVDLIKEHRFIKKKITAGPFENLENEHQTIHALSLLLTDISFYQELRRKGYMDWDDGTYEAAIIIGYGWRKILPIKVKLTQSSADVHFETRQLIRDALKSYPKNTYLQFVAQRYSLSWYTKNNIQLQQSLGYFQTLANSRKRSELAVTMKTLGQSSLVDMGLRYQKPALIHSSLKKLERRFSSTQKNQNMILFAKAWASVYDNKKTQAKTLALKIAASHNSFLKHQAVHILKTLGETRKAASILKQ